MIDQKLIEIIPTFPLIVNPDDINESTRLEQDLQLFGFQGRAFMFRYSEVFDVDISKFRYEKYFSKGSIFSRLFDKYTRKKKDTLTLGELQKAISYKRINEKVLEEIRTNNPNTEPHKNIYMATTDYHTSSKDAISYVVIGIFLAVLLGFVAFMY